MSSKRHAVLEYFSRPDVVGKRRLPRGIASAFCLGSLLVTAVLLYQTAGISGALYDQSGYARYRWLALSGHPHLLGCAGAIINTGAKASHGPFEMGFYALWALVSFAGWMTGTFGLFFVNRDRLLLKIALFYLATVGIGFLNMMGAFLDSI